MRVEEFLNYFDYGEPPPEEGDFAIYAEGAPAPFGDNDRYHLLRFHLRGRTVEATARSPADLIFVVDVSGSMAAGNRLGLVKEALYLLLDELHPDDRVALVVYGTEGRVLLAPTGDREAIRGALGWLGPEGSTDQRFHDDTVDGGEIGAGHAVTALYEIELQRPLVGGDLVAALRLRYASTAAGEVVETAHRVGARDFAPVWESASRALRLSSLVAELAEVLKESTWARDGDLDEVWNRLQQVSPEFADDREVAELVSLAGKAADLRRRAS